MYILINSEKYFVVSSVNSTLAPILNRLETLTRLVTKFYKLYI